MKDALNAVNQRETRSNVKRLQDAKKQLEEAYTKQQESYARGKIDEIENAAEHQKFKLVWETVNEFTGRKSVNVGKRTAKSPEDCVQRWKDDFVNLLGQPPVITSKPTRPVFQQTLYLSTQKILPLTISPLKPGRQMS